MKLSLVLAAIFAAIVSSSFGAVIPQSTSAKVLYASQMGAKLNSDVYNGGGTDDTAALQAALNIAASGGYQLIVDGQALISAQLVLRSNTKLTFLPGAGLFVAPHANCTPLGNLQNTNYSTTNVVIEGGIINCNGNSQSEYQTNGFRLSGAPGVWGMWFAGADGVIIRDVKLMSAKAYTWLFNDSRNILMENCWGYYTNNTIITNTLYGNDGVHLMCNITNFTCRNFRYTAGSDDGFAIMTDETDFTLPVQDPRWTTNSGSMSNIVFDWFYIEGGKNIGKFQNYGSTNARADNVTLKNIRGQASSQGLLMLGTGAGYRANNLQIDGLEIEAGGSVDAFGSPILSLRTLLTDFVRLNNIRIRDQNGGGIGTVGLIDISGNVTNIIMDNVFIEGNANSVGSQDPAICIYQSVGNALEPLVSINNLIALKTYSVVDVFDGSTTRSPQGTFRLSNIQYTPGTILNGGLFTNFFCFPPTNPPAINQVATATSTRGDMAWTSINAPTITYTNLVSGLVYHNLTGRPQSVVQGIVLNVFNQVGRAEMSFYVDPANGTAWPKTNRMGQVCTASSITAAQQAILVASIPSGASYVLTNTSQGVSNSATPDANQTGQLITY
jgi:hypothetical protein